MIQEIDKQFFEKDWAARTEYTGYKCPRCGGSKFHNWITPEDTFHVSCDKCHKAPEMMPPSFVVWWRKHRHSGFVEDKRGLTHFGVEPNEAWHSDRYRTEFSGDTGYFYQSRYEYSAEEIEAWAKEQKEMEDYVQGDYSPMPYDAASAIIHACLQKLANKFSVREEFEKDDAELTEAQKNAQLMEVENKFGSEVDGWEKAKESYNELPRE